MIPARRPVSARVERTLTIGCYVDLFERPKQRGTVTRLPGPATYLELLTARSGVELQISSLTIGPGAYVLCFDHRAAERACLWLGPSLMLSDWSDAGITEAMTSLLILDREPRQDDPCGKAYVRKRRTRRGKK